MKRRVFWTVGLAFLVITMLCFSAWAVPGLLNYQGNLTDSGGNPLNGTFSMTFRLFNVETDGSPIWEETQSVLVVGGNYSVQLGTISPLDESYFASDDLYLELVAEGETLSPRLRLTSTAFAMKARVAESVADGAVTGVMLSNGAVTTGKVEDGAITGAKIASDQVTSAHISTNAVGGSELADDAVTSAEIADGSIAAVDLAERYVKATGDSMTGWLDVSAFTIGSTFGEAIRGTLSTPTNGAGVHGTSNGTNSHGVHGSATGIEGVGVFGWVDGDRAYGVQGVSSGIYGHGVQGVSSGNYGRGVFGEATCEGGGTCYGGYFNVPVKSSNGRGVYGYGKAYGGYFEASLNGIYAGGTTGGEIEGMALGVQATALGNDGIALHAKNSNAGSTNATIEVYNNGIGPLIRGFGGDGGWDEFRIDNDGSLHVYDPDVSGNVFYFEAEAGVLYLGSGSGTETGDDGDIRIYDGNGNITIDLDGATGIAETQVLRITGGSDLSEQFDINGLKEGLVPTPGMVVAIDPEKPGDLIISSKAYDKRVAGIISGAGGVKPGMLMGQEGSAADGNSPVALSGRVYCLTDASNGAIEPGDLLTTAHTPGHAMKVTDYDNAQGAILGKAMTSLDNGKGLVLVLVTLQ